MTIKKKALKKTVSAKNPSSSGGTMTKEDFFKKMTELGFPVSNSYVPQGWYSLVYNMTLAIKTETPGFIFGESDYIKEKFGTLRCYIVNALSEKTNSFVYQAEWESQFICEICGDSKGTELTEINDWQRTLCPRHTISEKSRRQR